MPEGETGRAQDLLFRVLSAARFQLRSLPAEEGIVLEARRGPEEAFAIYVRPIRPRAQAEEAFRARHEARRDRVEGLTPILLDYVPHMDLFATLPPGQARAPGVVALRSDEVVRFLELIAARPRERAPRRGPAAEAEQASSYLPAEGIGRLLESIPAPRLDAAPADRKLIQTGFSPAADAAVPQSPLAPLEPFSEYLFWFAVGTRTENSIETTEATLPEEVTAGARLSVVVFAFPGELAIDKRSRGVLEVDPEGGARAVEHAFEPELSEELAEDLLARFLFFRVRTPGRPGRYRLRCNLYFGSTLVQSRLVTAAVGARPTPGAQAIESILDYRLSATVDLASLARIPENDLSISINGSSDSHQFRFYREDGKKLFGHESSLSSGQVQSAIDTGRKALRMAAWGSEDEWDEKKHAYRYGTSPRLDRLTADLGRLALAGSDIYGALANGLVGGARARRELQRITAAPGKVQIATGNDGLYVPAGLFYDHKIDDLPSGQRFALCPDFAKDLSDRERELTESPCIKQGCAHREDEAVVCPSGFWGFRHELGWPASTDVPAAGLEHEGQPAMLVGVSTDSKLRRRSSHIANLGGLVPAQSLTVTENRPDFDARMSAREAQLVYLYCHGGVHRGAPYVEIGRPGDVRGRINYRHLMNGQWGEAPPRPLVFINGCHTTALGPSQILDLVRGFVEETEAAGVVGTELTVFEQLACEFSEVVFRALLLEREEIGKAVKMARLELLRSWNPLGLVYVPFVAAGTKLVPPAQAHMQSAGVRTAS